MRSAHEVVILCGNRDENLRMMEDELGIRILARGNELVLSGTAEAVRQAERLFEELIRMAREGEFLRKEEVRYALNTIRENEDTRLAETLLDRIEVPSRRHHVRPRTLGQKRYIEAIRHHDIVFG